MKKNILFIVLLLLIAGLWWYRYKMPADITFQTIRVEYAPGNSAVLSDLISEPSIIHFYATWCGPCMRELPTIKAFGEKYYDSSIPFYLITDDSWEQINSVQKKMGEYVRIVRVESIKDLGIHSIPVTYFLDENLVSQKEQLGACPWDDPDFMNEIQKIIHF